MTVVSAFLFAIITVISIGFTNRYDIFLDKTSEITSKKRNVVAYYDDEIMYGNAIDGGTVISDMLSLDAQTVIKVNGLSLNAITGTNERYNILEEARLGDTKGILSYITLSNGYIKEMEVDNDGNLSSVNYQLQ